MRKSLTYRMNLLLVFALLNAANVPGAFNVAFVAVLMFAPSLPDLMRGRPRA